MANEKEQQGRVPKTAIEAIEALSQICANVDNSAMGLTTPLIVNDFMKEVVRLKEIALSGLKEEEQSSDLKTV